jgi:hypothetical protein
MRPPHDAPSPPTPPSAGAGPVAAQPTTDLSPPGVAPAGAGAPPLPAPADRYLLGEEIGRGGMGAVLRARDPHLGRELAVKVLKGDGHDHPELLRRFVEEAQVCSQLQHPGIVPVHDLGRLEDGRPFIAMSKIVENAYHAVALDEHRRDYEVCLWEPSEEAGQALEQRWFVGAHADVGGGYADGQGHAERRLSDIALLWVQDRAGALGLGLDKVTVADTNYLGPVHDSYAEFLDGLYAREGPPHYRRVLSTTFGHEVLDPSIDRRRRADAAYRPPNEGLPALGG